MQIILCSAAHCRRMHKSSIAPPELIVYNQTKLLRHQYKTLTSVYPDSEIMVVIGHNASEIQNEFTDLPIKFICSDNYGTTGPVSSVRIALSNISYEEVLILNGDLYFNEAAIPLERGVTLVENYKDSHREVGSYIQEGYLKYLSYGAPYTWSQMILSTSCVVKSCFREGQFFLCDLVNEMCVDYSIDIQYKKNGIAFDIDSYRDLALAREMPL